MRGRAAICAAVLCAGGLAACAPMTPAAVERACLDRARAAEGPRGAVAVGIGSGGGVNTSLAVSVSDDYLRGRDPREVYETCRANGLAGLEGT